MRTALISLLILAASVGCGKASETAFSRDFQWRRGQRYIGRLTGVSRMTHF